MSKATQYPPRFSGDDSELREQLEKSAQITGQSVNKLIMACVRVALPGVVENLSPGGGRITNIDPLPTGILLEAYSLPDRDEKGVDSIISKQAKGVRD